MTEKFIEFDPAEARKALNEFGNSGRRSGRSERTSDKRLADGKTTFNANLFSFVVQMAWTPRTPEERNQAREARLKMEQEDAKAAANAAADAEASAIGEDAP